MERFLILVSCSGWPVLLARGALGCFPPALAYSVAVVSPALQVIRITYIGLGASDPVIVSFADAVSLTGGLLVRFGLLGC